jgi:hypothetical protein
MRKQNIRRPLKETLNDKFNSHPYDSSMELEIDSLENDIPIRAEEIFKKAHRKSVEHGNSVIEVINNTLYIKCINGHTEKIKEIEPLIKLDMSKKIILR